MPLDSRANILVADDEAGSRLALSEMLAGPDRNIVPVHSGAEALRQVLKQDFALIDISEFQRLLARKGFQLVEQENRSLPGGKSLWLGVFAKSQ